MGFGNGINSEPQPYVDVQAGEAESAGHNPFSFTGAALRDHRLRHRLSGQTYTSGVVTSTESFTYGYIEARVNMPAGSGLWPAFWLYEEDGGSSVDGESNEIDIVEHISGWPNMTTRNYWCTGCGSGAGFGSLGSRLVTPVSGPDATDYNQGWHTFGVDWRPGSLTWYVDGQVVDTYTGSNVSEEAMYVIANLAMGDGFGVGSVVTEETLAGTPLLGQGPLLLVDAAATDGGPVDAELDRVLAEDGFVYVLGARAFGVQGNASAAFADSLTGGAFAAATGHPVFLSDSTELHPVVQSALATVPRTYLLGGDAALSPSIQASLAGSVRVQGPSRDGTAVAMISEFWRGDASTNRIVIDGYEDNSWQWGLVAAGLAADQAAPILVTSQAGVSARTLDAVTEADSDVLLIGNFTSAEREHLVDQLQRAVDERP